MSDKPEVYVREGSRLLSGLPSIVWLFVALTGTVALMYYFPFTQAILGVVAMALLFAIGKWFGLSKEEVLSLMTSETPSGILPAGAPAPTEVEMTIPPRSRLGRFLL